MMLVYRSLSDIPSDFGPSVVTVGKFDGVHRGHAMVIDELVQTARDESLQSVVVTFDRNPLNLLAPEKAPTSLTSNEQKLELLEHAGVDVVCMVAFDRAFAELSADDFMTDVLQGALRARIVLVGNDFRFGHRGSGTIESLQQAAEKSDWQVRTVGNFRSTGDERKVSSSWIRELIERGDVTQAARILGRAPSVRATVVHGLQRGRELGFPTANLSPECEGLTPGEGVYAGWLKDETGEAHIAAISVGTNPTFGDGRQKTTEVYVPGRDFYLYDQKVEVGFVERLRGQVAFDNVEALINQMTDDVECVLEIMNTNESAPRAL